MTSELDIVARELDRVTQQLIETAREARTLAAGTNWHAPAAVAFHDSADAWASDVGRLGGLSEAARISVLDAAAASSGAGGR